MDCLEFEDRLQALVESRRRVLDADLQDHVSGCTDCRRRWRESLFLDEAIGVWRSQTETTDLTDVIVPQWESVQGMSADAQQRQPSVGAMAHPLDRHSVGARRRRRQAGLAVALAATVLLLLPTLWMGTTWEPAPPPQSPVAATLDPTMYDGIQSVLEQTQATYTTLAQEVSRAVPDWSVLFPNDAAPMPIDQPDTSWTDGLRRSLAPIGHDVNQAFDSLYRALPIRPPATS